MNLLYVYIIESQNGQIKNQGFNFSKEYDIEISEDSTTFHLTKRSNPFVYDTTNENLYNISVVVGKNGSGKSTLLNEILMPSKNLIYLFESGGQYYHCSFVAKDEKYENVITSHDIKVCIEDKYIKTFTKSMKNQQNNTLPTFYFYTPDILSNVSTAYDASFTSVINHSLMNIC